MARETVSTREAEWYINTTSPYPYKDPIQTNVLSIEWYINMNSSCSCSSSSSSFDCIYLSVSFLCRTGSFLLSLFRIYLSVSLSCHTLYHFVLDHFLSLYVMFFIQPYLFVGFFVRFFIALYPLFSSVCVLLGSTVSIGPSLYRVVLDLFHPLNCRFDLVRDINCSSC